ncbi:hypothetical protein C0989_000559, partial [Termitomyces sp. Mn162]
YKLRACATTQTFLRQPQTLLPTWLRNPSHLGDLPSNSGSTPINCKASAYPAFYLCTHKLVLAPVQV